MRKHRQELVLAPACFLDFEMPALLAQIGDDQRDGSARIGRCTRHQHRQRLAIAADDVELRLRAALC